MHTRRRAALQAQNEGAARALLLHRSSMSPMFITKEPGAGGTLTHSPPSSSCSSGETEAAGVSTELVCASDSMSAAAESSCRSVLRMCHCRPQLLATSVVAKQRPCQQPYVCMWPPLTHLQARLVISRKQRDAAKVSVCACTHVAGFVGRAAAGGRHAEAAGHEWRVQPTFVRTGAQGHPSTSLPLPGTGLLLLLGTCSAAGAAWRWTGRTCLQTCGCS